MMDSIVPAFTECVEEVRRHAPQIPFLSNVSGTWITPEEAVDAGYWSRHLRQPVRFSECVETLLKESNRVFLEVGPGQTLSTLVKRHPKRSKEQVVLSSIRHPKEQKSDIEFILTTLGRLWLAGIKVDWSGYYKDERRHRIPLPTYPFERKRFWVEPAQHEPGVRSLSSAGGQPRQTEDLEPIIQKRVEQFASNPVSAGEHDAPRTEAERLLWEKIRGKQLRGYQFYRQKTIGNYIVDFYCRRQSSS